MKQSILFYFKAWSLYFDTREFILFEDDFTLRSFILEDCRNSNACKKKWF